MINNKGRSNHRLSTICAIVLTVPARKRRNGRQQPAKGNVLAAGPQGPTADCSFAYGPSGLARHFNPNALFLPPAFTERGTV